jgi:hypothetical protein
MQTQTLEDSYESLVEEAKRLQEEGTLPKEPTREQRISWAYGQTKIENSAVTREDAVQAVDSKPSSSRRR